MISLSSNYHYHEAENNYFTDLASEFHFKIQICLWPMRYEFDDQILALFPPELHLSFHFFTDFLMLKTPQFESQGQIGSEEVEETKIGKV